MDLVFSLVSITISSSGERADVEFSLVVAVYFYNSQNLQLA